MIKIRNYKNAGDKYSFKFANTDGLKDTIERETIPEKLWLALQKMECVVMDMLGNNTIQMAGFTFAQGEKFDSISIGFNQNINGLEVSSGFPIKPFDNPTDEEIEEDRSDNGFLRLQRRLRETLEEVDEVFQDVLPELLAVPESPQMNLFATAQQFAEKNPDVELSIGHGKRSA